MFVCLPAWLTDCLCQCMHMWICVSCLWLLLSLSLSLYMYPSIHTYINVHLRPRKSAQNIKQFSACTAVMCAITINYQCINGVWCVCLLLFFFSASFSFSIARYSRLVFIHYNSLSTKAKLKYMAMCSQSYTSIHLLMHTVYIIALTLAASAPISLWSFGCLFILYIFTTVE